DGFAMDEIISALEKYSSKFSEGTLKFSVFWALKYHEDLSSSHKRRLFQVVASLLGRSDLSDDLLEFLVEASKTLLAMGETLVSMAASAGAVGADVHVDVEILEHTLSDVAADSAELRDALEVAAAYRQWEWVSHTGLDLIRVAPREVLLLIAPQLMEHI